jgi:hypothetical protein
MLDSSSAAGVIQQMVTPALLLVATASLLGVALGRMVRISEHVHRICLDNLGRAELESRAGLFQVRLHHAGSALSLYFGALAMAAMTCLALLVDHFTAGKTFWIPLAFAFAAAILQIAGTFELLREARIASSQVKQELHAAIGNKFGDPS